MFWYKTAQGAQLFFFFFLKVYDTRHSLDTEHHTGLGEYFCSRWWSTQILKYQCFSCTASRVSNSKPKVWYLLTANGNMVSNSSCTSRFILDALFLASLSASGSRLADRTHHVVECQNERNGHPEMTTSHFTSDSVFKCASEFTGFSGTPSWPDQSELSDLYQNKRRSCAAFSHTASGILNRPRYLLTWDAGYSRFFTSSVVGRTAAAITDLISSSVTATLAKVSLRYGDLFVFTWHKKAVEMDSQVYSFNLPAKSTQFNISFDASSVKHVIVLSVVGWWNVNNKTW